MVLKDAVLLAHELTDTEDIHAARARYEARRKQRVEWVIGKARRDNMRRLPRPIRNALRVWRTKALRKSLRTLKAPIRHLMMTYSTG